jgi:hypothetical protein
VRNLYLVQVVDNYGPNKFLPLAVAYQWLFAQLDIRVSQSWRLAGVLIEKSSIKPWIDSMHAPDMVAMSSYVWNWNYNCRLAREIKRRWPSCVICMGGPQIPKNNTAWIKDHPYIDVAVLGENEHGFREILATHNPSHWCRIPGVITQDQDTLIQAPRTQQLDLLPSPMLTGFYDQVMSQYPKDTRWQVTWESMRGCPYHCAFCDIGESYWNKTYWFDLERVRQEIAWMGDRKIEYVSVCDSNWGISERDIEITQWVIDTKLRCGFPKFWDVTWAKNNRARVQHIALMDKRAGTRLFKGITFSVQSLDPGTLQKVDRFNLTDRELASGMEYFQKQDIATYSEVIWPMPGETLDSFERGLQRLIDMGQRDFLMVHPLVLTPNAPMNQSFYRRLNKLHSKNVPLDTFWLSIPGPDYVIETVDAVTGTETADFQEVIQGHMLAHWLIVLYYYGWGHVVLEYLHRVQHIKHVDAIKRLIGWIQRTPDTIFHHEHNDTKASLESVFSNGQLWGRQVLDQIEYWEYKSATSTMFHFNRDKVEQCLMSWLNDDLGIQHPELLLLNMMLCHDWRRQYPISLNLHTDVADLTLSVMSRDLILDHWDHSITSDVEFMHVAYHYQRKNRYWRCQISTAGDKI